MRENSSVEFKEVMTKQYLKTVCAYANYGDGRVLFGVNDQGNPVGVEHPEEICLAIENQINDSIQPKPSFTLEVNQRTKVVTLTVFEGSDKPFFYKGKAYCRRNTSTVEVDGVELRRLALEGANMYFEELPYKGEDLSFSYLEQTLIDRLGIQSLTTDLLRTLGLCNREKQYNNAAALVADKNLFHGIDMARFGKSISEILDRETVAGKSVLQQYQAAVEIFKRYYEYEQVEGFERKTVERIPEKAFREALANAVIHRTWDVNAHIRISMFADRVEIASPGGLPREISEEEYLHDDISYFRNPTLANLFFRLGYIEMFGTGVKRIREAYQGEEVKPQFRVTENTIQVILPCKDKGPGLTTNGEKVLETLKGGRLLSSTEIAEKLGWSKDKVIRVLNDALPTGLIQKEGIGRGTRYKKQS